jgi:hypothetical protein
MCELSDIPRKSLICDNVSKINFLSHTTSNPGKGTSLLMLSMGGSISAIYLCLMFLDELKMSLGMYYETFTAVNNSVSQ